jgi:hypothetical protein
MPYAVYRLPVGSIRLHPEFLIVRIFSDTLILKDILGLLADLPPKAG